MYGASSLSVLVISICALLVDGAASRSLCGKHVPGDDVTTNIPLLTWSFPADCVTDYWWYRVRVSSTCADDGDMWDSGEVYQENLSSDSVFGAALYNGAPLSGGVGYTYFVSTWYHNTSCPTISNVSNSFFTASSLPTAKQEATQQVAALSGLYNRTLTALVGRIQPNGYTETSSTGAYPGQFIRDSSAQILALIEAGDLPHAQLMLRFLLQAFTNAKLPHAPHILFWDNNTNVITFDMIDQPDGNFHLVTAYAKYCKVAQDSAMMKTFYPIASQFVKYYVQQQVTTYYNATLQLLWNPNLEHSRYPVYMSTYDIVTNAWAEQALLLMEDVAQSLGQTADASLFRNFATLIAAGISKSLSYTYNGMTFFAELRLKTSPDDLLFGMSWANLAPIAAAQGGMQLDQTTLQNTLLVFEQLGGFAWADYQVLLTFDDANNHTNVDKAVIGKGLGWELLANGMLGRWNRLNALLRWLAEFNVTPLYGEQWVEPLWQQNKTYTTDPGNQEQASWWILGQTVLQKLLL